MRYEAAAAANEAAYQAKEEAWRKYFAGDMSNEDYQKIRPGRARDMG